MRRVMDGAGALLFTAYVVLLLLLTLPPLWVGLLVLPAGHRPGRLLRRCARLVIGASGCRLRVSGAERLRAAGSAMLVANHASYIDSAVLMAALPIDFRFVANHGLTRLPLIGTAIRKARYLTVDRRALRARRACILDMVETLRQGASIVVFPEATIARGSALLPFRAGAFRAATEVGRPVVPVSIRGTREILPYRSWAMRRGAIDVTIHEPIESSEKGRRAILRVRDRACREIASSLATGRTASSIVLEDRR